MKTIVKALNNFVTLFSINKKPINNHQISAKNKWLYPGDSFGKMEYGVEYDKK